MVLVVLSKFEDCGFGFRISSLLICCYFVGLKFGICDFGFEGCVVWVLVCF